MIGYKKWEGDAMEWRWCAIKSVVSVGRRAGVDRVGIDAGEDVIGSGSSHDRIPSTG